MTGATVTDGLKGKRVVVTAGGDGIGKAVACAFHDAGARVHICDVVAERITALDGISGTLCDVGDAGQVDHLFDEAEAALGGLDILVNNAGISGPTAGVEDVTVEDWDRTIAVDLNGQFYCARRAVPLIKAAGGGSIVNLASTAGILGYPNRTPYAAAKWAVVGLTKSLAMELGGAGIRVNAICPGPVDGARMDRVLEAEGALRGISAEAAREHELNKISLHTFVQAEDIAAMILFICSDAGAKVSGQALAVDGNTETLA
jgi:NAD(P)-dependent dehydrogenase (short-subunit alcohol dehydrogenase family)